MKRLTVLVALLMLLVGCVKSPEPWKPDGKSAEVLVEDFVSADASATLDTLSDELLPELVADVELASPTCFEALQCLMDKKEWAVGDEIPQDDCTGNMSEEQTMETDALLGCMSAQCQSEYDAWRSAGPGAAELDALYACLIGFCARTIAVCVGGNGTGDCADALYCLNLCSGPQDMECNLGCLENTSDYQSGKTGDFLECIVGECPFATGFTIGCITEAGNNKCFPKCFELAG